MLSVGTAGGFSQRGACIGDVFLSTKCVFHDRRIPEGSNKQRNNQSCGAVEEYGFGHFRSPNLIGLATAAGLKQGVVTTGDSLDSNNQDMQNMMSEGAVVKDMEAASVAWVCYHVGIPFAAIKAITDIVDESHGQNRSNKNCITGTRDTFETNLGIACEALKDKISLVLRLVDHTPLSDLATIKTTV